MEIRLYPDPILRKKAEPILNFDSELENTIRKMDEIMLQSDGAGLAGPQVGLSQQIFLANAGQGLKVFINPKITRFSKEKITFNEGCLSFPGIFLDIERPKKIEIEFLDKQGKRKKIKADNLLSRIIQHEYDHLQGVLFIDRISLDEKLRVRNQLMKLEKSKQNTEI